MPIEIVVPRLGWSMDEGVFAGWLIEPGASIAGGEMLFQLEGEKATQDVETFDAGILCVPDGAPQLGDTVAVGQVLGYLLKPGEEPPASLNDEAPLVGDGIAAHHARPDSFAGPAVRRLARELEVDWQAIVGSGPNGRVTADDVRNSATVSDTTVSDTTVSDATASAASVVVRDRIVATPRARRIARERGVELKSVRGSGRGGRIRECDVPAADHGQPLRRAIARRMLAGVQETAPVTLTKKVRVDRLVQLRAQWKQHPVSDLTPTLNELVLKLTCTALGKHASLNGIWRDDRLRVSPAVHLALAVDTSAGLLAPVIENAESLSLTELSETSRGLVQRARSGELSESELSGGTFTVSNLGGLGVDVFTPILNLPQVAILGVGRVVQEPVVDKGQVVAGWTLQLSLTIDHRAVDGADGARLLQTLGELMEFPAEWLSRGHSG